MARKTIECLNAELAAVRKSLEDERRNLEQHVQEVRKLRGQLQETERDRNRHRDDGSRLDARLKAIQHAVVAVLKSKHNTGTTAAFEIVRGVSVEEPSTEEVRFLRHVHDLACQDVPF